MTDRRYVVAVAQREFLTVLRTPTLLAVGAGAVMFVGGLAWLRGAGAYLPLVLDLLTPTEVLVPVLAFAFGYRALLGDRERGELEAIRTYPIPGAGYVCGVYLGRAVALLSVLLLGLAAAGAAAASGRGSELSVVASHATVDSPAPYLRYVALTSLYALVALAVALLVSAAARSTRGGLALGTGAVLLLVAGFDGALIGATGGRVLSPDAASALVALNPGGAYRSLVFALSVAPTGVSVPAGPPAVASAAGLLAWGLASLGLASMLAWR